MSQTDVLANYSFLPWMKKGLSTKVQEDDELDGSTNSSNQRPTINVKVKLNGNLAHSEEVQIIGPGDIVGINSNAIARIEPGNNSDNFLPNYMPFIEFYDEDFPWRYTPAMPASTSTKKLTPWLSLIVLKTSEFDHNKSVGGKLPFIQVTSQTSLPDPEHLWAYSHVHVSDNLGTGTAAKSKLAHIRKNDPNRVYARILCSRKLDENESYTAFIVPTFFTGREAGLNPDVDLSTHVDFTDLMQFAWDNSQSTSVNLPVYYQWEFETRDSGDFEELARKLKPKNLPASIGDRKMDIRVMGYGIDQLALTQETLGIGGALKAPNSSFQDWDDLQEEDDFNTQLTEMLDQTSNNQSTGWLSVNWTTSSDPIVGPPMYGRWHAKKDNIGTAPPWMRDLNLKPRNRAAAGLGSEIVRKNQEEFVKRAWLQVGDVLQANANIIANYLSALANQRLFDRNLVAMNDEDFLRTTSAAQPRILIETTAGGSYESATHQVAISNLPVASQSGAMKKITNRNSRISRNANTHTVAATGNEYQRTILTNLNDANETTVTAAVPKHEPSHFMNASTNLSTLNSYVSNVISSPATNYAFTVNNGSNGVTSYNVFEDLEIFDAQVPNEPTLPDLVFNDTRVAVETEMSPYSTMIDRQGNMIYQDNVMIPIPEPILCEPNFPDALYERLQAISKEFIIPGISQITENSVSLLETNQEFIESLLVGANHEMARELLWREYPTDQRGTYFTQFWRTLNQAFSFYPPPEAEVLAKHDIRRISDWPQSSSLGDTSHKNNGAVAENLVLVVRGELLRKFPNVVVYARPADLRRDAEVTQQNPSPTVDANGNSTVPRAYLDNDSSKFKYPIFRAQVEPDTVLFGFELTAEEAVGVPITNPGPDYPNNVDNLDYPGGYYFVFQEREGDIQFGLDTGSASIITDWNDANWKNFGVNNPHEYLDPTATVQPSGPLNPDFDPSPGYLDSHDNVAWNTSSADAAYVLYQPPVMVAMHAMRLLLGLI